MFLAKAPTLTVLIPVRDEKGVMRFPSNKGPYPGLFHLIDNALPLSSQAVLLAQTELKTAEQAFTPLAPIDPVLKREGSPSSILFLLKPEGQILEVDLGWPTIADILRSLPQGQTRVAYMKALQYLAGAAEAEVSVLEVDDEVRARLREQENNPLN